MIRQICLYCNRDLGHIEEDEVGTEQVSHGLCPDCFPKFVAGTGIQFADFLDALPAPIFVFGPEGRALGANARGRVLAAKGLAELQNLPVGEVFECAYAYLPGGCGEPVHCKSCTIRSAVLDTARSGRSCSRVPAYMDLGDQTGQRSVRYLISTELAGGVVLLRIDDVQAPF